MKILGIGHRKRVGKDAFANMIVRHLRTHVANTNAKVAGFSDTLKECCYNLYCSVGMKPAQHYEDFPEDRDAILLNGKTVRQVWIEFGNHCRLYDPAIWVNATLGVPNVDYLIIKDVRFLNEIEAIHKRGGTVVKLVNPNVPEENDAADGVLKDYLDWDHVIVNDSTLAELNKKAKILSQTIFGV